MEIQGSVALVTGANRGFGRALTQELLRQGAATVYGAARDASTITDPGVTPVQLDVTDHRRVAELAAELGDVTIVINNAGYSTSAGPRDGDTLDDVRNEFEINYYGPLAVSRAFAPVLAQNGGGALVNVLSVLSWLAVPIAAGYCASKSAAWSLTNSLRVDLRPQRTLVTGVHVGLMDTRMAEGLPGDKSDPEEIARLVIDAIAAGREEVVADEMSRQVKAGLSGDLESLYAHDPLS
jgi:NAD(P)-dependent dehydrogenase (short-subunit alcohol dehydrogenase family)